MLAYVKKVYFHLTRETLNQSQAPAATKQQRTIPCVPALHPFCRYNAAPFQESIPEGGSLCEVSALALNVEALFAWSTQ